MSIEIIGKENISILKMQFPSGNSINNSFLKEFNKILDEINNSEIKSLVVTGNGHIFSTGLNLIEVYDYDRHEMTGFIKNLDDLFYRIFTFPKPIVSAINGHAVAGGCILAMATDYRIMASGQGTIGINEILLGIPFPAVAFEVARYTLGNASWTKCFLEGKRFLPEEAFQIGLVHSVVDESSLTELALKKAEQFRNMPLKAFQQIKKSLQGPTIDWIDKITDSTRAHFIEEWFSPITRQIIQEKREELLKRKSVVQ